MHRERGDLLEYCVPITINTDKYNKPSEIIVNEFIMKIYNESKTLVLELIS